MRWPASSLMDRKRNILVREMMQLIDRAAAIQDQIAAAYAEAYAALQLANVTLGVVSGFAHRCRWKTAFRWTGEA